MFWLLAGVVALGLGLGLAMRYENAVCWAEGQGHWFLAGQ